MRTIIKTGLISFVILLLAFLLLRLVSNWNRKISQENSIRYLPSCKFFNVNDTPVLLDSMTNKQTLLIVFNPDCEHCLYEIREIIKHLDNLSNAEIIMITTVDKINMKAFMAKEGLDSIPKIKVLRCEPDVFQEVFGNTPSPTVFIYNTDNKLQNVFKGEVKIEAITNIIKSD